VALTDKDQDGFKAWDGKGKAPSTDTVLDPNDNDPKVTPVSNDSSSNDANYQAWLKQQNLAFHISEPKRTCQSANCNLK
jgi:hypothetical protein